MTTSVCALCGLTKTLRDSHIIANVCYKPLLAAGPAVQVHVSDDTVMYSQKRQSGIWEPLCCDDCEKMFNPHETYFGRVWWNEPTLPAQLTTPAVELRGLNYHHFKLLHLANLWRAHASKRPEFAQVDLGIHADRIRVLLQAGDAGRDSVYPIYGIALANRDGSLAALDVSPYLRKPIDGKDCYIVLYSGCTWLIQLSPDPILPCHLKEDGSMTLAVQPWSENALVRAWAKRYNAEQTKPKPNNGVQRTRFARR